jgi:histidinol-phosphatase (PHP family)
VIGHLDYVRQFVKNKKTAFKSLGLCKDIEKILEDIVEKKIFLEINSRGLRGPYKDVMPRKNIVKDFVRFGGKLISIGSDAHSIQEIGQGIKEIQFFLSRFNKSKLKLLFEG